MDIEQLKLILDMLGAAGEGSVNLFLIYLAYLTVQNLIMYAVPIVLFTLGYKVIKHANSQPSRSQDTGFILGLARAYDGSTTLTEEERTRVIGAVADRYGSGRGPKKDPSGGDA